MNIISKNPLTLLAIFILIISIPITVNGVRATSTTSPPSGSPTSAPSASPVPGGSLDQPQIIKVLVLKYFPLNPLDNTRLDGTEMGPDFANVTLTSIRATANSEVQNMVNSLTEASKFRGYKNPGAIPYLNFSIVDNKEYLKKIPLSTLPAYSVNSFRPDLRKMLQDEGFNICDYVDNQGVTQVWLRGYHFPRSTPYMEPDESNMSMGRSSQSFWNRSTYGDVSNGQHYDDMPLCNKTYVLYGVGGLGNTLENHLHQTENLFIFADFADNSQKLFRKIPENNSVGHDTFERPLGQGGGVTNHCGNVHSPPNTTSGYDWRNETIVKSDCEDWKPDGGGQVRDVSCHTWYGSAGDACRVPAADDGGAKFKIWLMQSIPGFNNTLIYQGNMLRNWWEFYADFDAALARGKKLTKTPSVSPTSIPTPTSTPTESPTPTPTPAPTPVTVSSITFNGSTLDISGRNTITTTLHPTGTPPQEIVSVVTNYSRGDPHTFYVKFIYQPPATPTPTPSLSPSPSPTSTPSPTPAPTPSPTHTPSSSPTPTSSPTPSLTPSLSPTPTETPIPTESPTTIPTPTPIQNNDLNDDGIINSFDIAILFNEWRKRIRGEYSTTGDFNNDGVINSIDYSILRNQISY